MPAETQASLELAVGDTLLRIDMIADDMARVRMSPDGRLAEDASWTVPAPLRAARAAAPTEADGGTIVLRTSAMVVRVDRDTLALRIETPAGDTILADAPVGAVRFTNPGFVLRKTLREGERCLGLGDKTGPLDRRGGRFENWTTDQNVEPAADPLYKAIPFVVGTGGPAGSWGLLLDVTWRSTFDVGRAEPGVLTLSADDGALDMTIIVGAGVREVVRRYADLTGHAPLPPKWAFGYQQSRWSYMSADAVRAIAARLRAERIPTDVIWLDIGFQDRDRPFTTDPARFADLPGLVAELRAQGIRTIVITDLHIAALPGRGYAAYDGGMAAGAFIRRADGEVFVGKVWPGPSVFPDFTRAAVRRWWGTLYADFVAAGVAGFWVDMNEPAVFDEAGKTIPPDARQRIETPGFATRETAHAEVHNLTGLLNSEATWRGLAALSPDERPFVMTRSTFAGGQKWAVTWTGDNDATWEQLALGVAQTLSLGLSGFPYVAVDVGGFNGTPTPALLTRWFQVQAFMPLFRDHTAKETPPQEPWVHGPEHTAIRRRFVEERYRLMPYIYALAEVAHRTGEPMVRPLFHDHPEMLDAPDAPMTFALGGSLVVAASPTPGSDAPYRVVLPPGRWFDYWTGAEVETSAEGLLRIVTETPRLDHLPVYVADGTILPRQALVQSTAEAPEGPLHLDVWPGRGCAADLYDDDGHSMGFARGMVFRRRVRCLVVEHGIDLVFDTTEGEFVPGWREWRIVLHGWSGPFHASMDGVETLSCVDAGRGTTGVTIPTPEKVATTLRIRRLEPAPRYR